MTLKDKTRIIIFSLFMITAVIVAVFIDNKPFEEYFVSAGTKAIDTLIIDPGHGGEDGGAVTGEGVRESNINLAISQKMAALCDLCGIPYNMTRDGEDIDYPKELNTTRKRKVYDQNRRVNMVNDNKNAVLISIHQNKFTCAGPRGPQVFYNKATGGKELAELIQNNMNKVLYPQNRRIAVAVSADILLMKKVSCTAVLAECGFLSNPEEAANLADVDYQNKIALCIVSAYIQYSGNKQLA